MGCATYIPLPLECLQIHKLSRDILVAQVGFVLFKQSAAKLRVFNFRYRIFYVGLFEAVEGDDDTINFREGIVQVSLRCCFGELDFLHAKCVSQSLIDIVEKSLVSQAPFDGFRVIHLVKVNRG